MDSYVVGLGEVLFDCLPTGKKLGGAPANFAYHVSQFGLNGLAVSAIGKDEDGAQVKRELTEHHLRFHLEEVDEPTGTVQVSLDNRGIPQYDICQGVAYDNIPWTDSLCDIARHTKAVCFGSLAQRSEVSRSTILRFLDTMPCKENTLRIFDVNLRQNWYSPEVVMDSLQRSNALKLNDEELPVISSMLSMPSVRKPTDGHPLSLEDVEASCNALMETFSLRILILTCGTHGSFVFGRGETPSFLPTPEVEVVDTVGAGDSFTGSFCAAILSGKSIREAHSIGVETSAFVCTKAGAMPEYEGGRFS